MPGLDHPTTNVGIDPTVTLALVGPPAAGKTTVRNLLVDLDVPGIDVSDASRSGEPPEYLSRSLDFLDSSERDLCGVVAIEGLRSDAEIDTVDSIPGNHVLTVRVDTPTEYERRRRFIERETDTADGQTATTDEINSALETFFDRRKELIPGPDHTVMIENADDTSTTTLLTRLDRLVTSIRFLRGQ